MNRTMFDTHHAVKTITESGFDDKQADAIVTTIHKAMNQNLATKSDVVLLKTDVDTLRADMDTVKADVSALKADVNGLKADLLVLKWMVGLVIAVEVLPFLKYILA